MAQQVTYVCKYDAWTTQSNTGVNGTLTICWSFDVGVSVIVFKEQRKRSGMDIKSAVF